jgi:hypothetical protein
MPNRKVLYRMIAAHAKAMLHPDPPRTVCGGAGIRVTVEGSAPGGDVHLANAPACGWPGGVSVLAYWAAGDSCLSAAEASHYLAVATVRLYCDEDAVLLRQPTAWSRVRACLSAQPKG